LAVIRRLRPDLEEVQRTVGGKRQWMYLGIGMKNGTQVSENSSIRIQVENVASRESLDQ